MGLLSPLHGPAHVRHVLYDYREEIPALVRGRCSVVTSGGFEWDERGLSFRLRQSGNFFSDTNCICSKICNFKNKIQMFFSDWLIVPHLLPLEKLWSIYSPQMMTV